MFDPLEQVQSTQAAELQNWSSDALILELKSKRSLYATWPVAAALCIIAGILSVPYLHWFWITMAILLALLIMVCVWWDQQRKTTVLFYDLQPPVLPAYEALHDAFEGLARSGGKWCITAQKTVYDRKYHAGADTNVRRAAIELRSKAPPYVRTNVSIPRLSVRAQILYFLPDRVLVYDASGIGELPYVQLNLKCNPTQFIENQYVPADARVVGHTWKYVNKSGGPDRRFNDNTEIPIALYTEVHFTSQSGLNEYLLFSNSTNAENFQKQFREYQGCLEAVRTGQPTSSEEQVSDGGQAELQPPTGDHKYYYLAEEPQGPFTVDELREMAEAAIIQPQTLVCSAGDQTWTSYENFLACRPE